MKRLIIAALAVAAMVGCTKDLDGLNGSYDNAVSFSIGDIADTRAVIKSAWSEDGTDRVGISSTDDEYTNVEYSVGESGALSPAGTTTIYYPSQGSEMTFYAYYPYDSAIDGETLSIDVSDQSKSIDLLVSDQASGTQGAADGVEFTFTHALSAVEITVRGSDTVDVDMETLELYTEQIVTDASYALVENTLSLGTTKKAVDFELSPNADGSYLAQAILLPSDYIETKIYFSFKDTEDDPHLYELALGKDYKSGYKYTYDAKIGMDYVDFTSANELEWSTSTPEGVATSQPDIVFDTDTYYIYSAKGLLAFSYLVSNTANTSGATLWGDSANYNFSSADNVNADAVLMADIDLGVLGATTNWSPIGTSDKQFSGTFDGSGYTIEGLYIDDTSDGADLYQGLFGYTYGATLKNITLKDVSVSGYENVGGLVGCIKDVTISNCHVVGDNSSVSGARDSSAVGGVVGYAVHTASTIINSSNSAAVCGTNVYGPYAGGILGANDGATNTIIVNCYNSGDISGSSNAGYIGGIVGFGNQSYTITNCYSSGTISGGSSGYMGGIIGNATLTATLNYCYSNTTDWVGSSSNSTPTTNNCSTMTTSAMQDESFATTLNNGAYTYNQGDVALLACGWVAVTEGTPDLDPDLTPTLSADIAYVGGLYEIYSAEGLLAFSYLVSNTTTSSGATMWGDSSAFDFSSGTNAGIEGKLMQDIDLSVLGETTSWSPIGKTGDGVNKPFSGTFDGGGHTIKNLYINNTSSLSGYYQGLFGYTSGAIFQNITLESVMVTGYDYVGGLVGYIQGSTISNCHVLGGTVSATNNYVGGVVGYTTSNACTIINSSSSATVSGGNTPYAGGILGYNKADNTTIVNCYNNGSVSGSGSAGYVGGIVGSNGAKLTINTCYSSGAISGGATGYMAGIVGYSTSTLTLNYCYYENGGDSVGSASTGACTQDDYSSTVSVNVMKDGSTFWTWLNNGASTYNYNNSDSDIEAYGWTGEVGSYPTLDSSKTPTFTADTDIVYDNGTYQISTMEGMQAFADLVNGAGNSQIIYTAPNVAAYFDFSKTNLSIDGKLVANINLGLLPNGWTPIGTENNSYAGTFDGGGHTIEGLTISSSADYQGLFGITDKATLQNISLVGITVTGGSNVGGLAGAVSQTTINNCSVSGSSSVKASDYVGGLVGYSNSAVEITNCYVTGSVTGTGSGAVVAGVVGCIDSPGSNITNCYNKSSVTCSDATNLYPASVGGIVGYDVTGSNGSTAITNCYNVGALSGGADGYTGGIVGYVSSSYTTLTYCFANTDLVGSGSPTIYDDSKVMTDENMKLPTFVTTLNTGAYTYNLTEPETDAYGWKAGTDYPALDSSIVPTLTE